MEDQQEKNPKISVIMSVYNCEKTLEEAIESIIAQTYKNWEFVICNDCSTDNTQIILDRYKELYPNQFVLLRNEKNMKLSFSLNECLKIASGSIIARMDGDDISDKHRFEEQIKVLLAHPEYQLVGTCSRRFDENGLHDIVKYPEYPDRNTLMHNEPFLHATIMLYKSVFEKLGGYRVSKLTERSQDLDLWFKFYYNGYEGYNIQKPLYLVREDMNAIKRRTLRVRIRGLRITFEGYKMLNYPWHCYIKRSMIFIIKVLTPPQLAMLYRKYQAKRGESFSRKQDQ